MLNVRYLVVFRAIAKTGSVSAAARTLHVSQPAVTKTIRLLEDELGLTLFDRIKGRLVITREAEQLMPQVERLFGDVSAIEGLADEIRQGFSGSITIASVTTLSTSLVARAVEPFHKKYPRVRVDIKSLSTLLATNYVATNAVDIGILDIAPAAGLDMEVIDLCRSEVGCVMRAAHPLAHRASLGPADITGETLIAFGEETLTGLHLREAFQDANLQHNITFTVNHTLTAYSLVKAGVGMAVVDSFPILFGGHDGLVIRPFRPLIETRPHVVFSKERPVPIVARKFVDELVKATAALIADSETMINAP